MRGAWMPRQNNAGIQLDQFEQLLGMHNNDLNDEDIELIDPIQVSRNKPLLGIYKHKKHQSLKLSSQKPKHKFNPNEDY